MLVYVVSWYDSDDMYEGAMGTQKMIENIFDCEDKAKNRVKELTEKFKLNATYDCYEVL